MGFSSSIPIDDAMFESGEVFSIQDFGYRVAQIIDNLRQQREGRDSKESLARQHLPRLPRQALLLSAVEYL